MGNNSKSELGKSLGSKDASFIEIITHSFWAFIILVVASGIQFIFDFLLARKFGAYGSGLYYLSFSIITTLSLFGHLGLDRTAVRLIPPLIKVKDNEGAKSVIQTSISLTVINTTIISFALFVLASWISKSVFQKPELTIYLQIFSLSVIPFSLRYLYGGFLRAFRRTRESLFVERIIIYFVGIISIFTIGNIWGLKAMAASFVAGCFISLAVGIYYLNKNFPSKTSRSKTFSKRLLLASGVPLLFVAVTTQLNGQISTLILGSFGTNNDVGIYNAALKVSLLLAMILTAINTIVGTNISELYASKKLKKLERILNKTSALGFIVAIPIFTIIVLFPANILRLFGSEFANGSTALIILACGQLINVAVGPTLFTLAMTGHEKALAKAIAFSLLINVSLGLILIPVRYVEGAAIATAVSIALSNLTMLLLVRRYLSIWTLPFKYIKVWIRRIVF